MYHQWVGVGPHPVLLPLVPLVLALVMRFLHSWPLWSPLSVHFMAQKPKKPKHFHSTMRLTLKETPKSPVFHPFGVFPPGFLTDPVILGSLRHDSKRRLSQSRYAKTVWLDHFLPDLPAKMA